MGKRLRVGWKLEAIILSEWLGRKDLCRAHPVKRELS